PEQGQDAHHVDIRADVYSLGCTLYKLLTGQAPFGGSGYNTPFKKMEAHARHAAPPLGAGRPDVPAGLADLLGRMLAKDPEDRPATPGVVAAALEPFTAGADLRRLVSDPKAAAPSPAAPAEGS